MYVQVAGRDPPVSALRAAKSALSATVRTTASELCNRYVTKPELTSTDRMVRLRSPSPVTPAAIWLNVSFASCSWFGRSEGGRLHSKPWFPLASTRSCDSKHCLAIRRCRVLNLSHWPSARRTHVHRNRQPKCKWTCRAAVAHGAVVQRLRQT